MTWSLITLSSILISIGVQAASILKGVQGKGKYLTRPMVKAWAYWYAKHLLKKHNFGDATHLRIQVTSITFRFWQWCILFALIVWASILDLTVLNIPSWVYCCVYWWPWTALHADDLLTLIDRDKWKKRWMTAKNKIRWKMVLPVPVRA